MNTVVKKNVCCERKYSLRKSSLLILHAGVILHLHATKISLDQSELLLLY
jgi:hypothetical protein